MHCKRFRPFPIQQGAYQNGLAVETLPCFDHSKTHFLDNPQAQAETVRRLRGRNLLSKKLRGKQIDTVTIWFLIIGSLLVLMGLMGSVLQRLPLSPAMLYLAIGFVLGPSGVGLIALDLKVNAPLLKMLSEIAVLISLFAVGLRLRVELADRIWWLPWRLGMLAMLITIGLLTAVGVYLLNLPLGAALLLAAILAPTDPVLASDVQIKDVGDRDRIRFSLSGEGGLNDGTTFPFIMAGLYLLGVQDAQAYSTFWGVIGNALWGIAAGLFSGWIMGRIVVGLVLHLRQNYHQALGMEEFLALGLIALTYGVSQLIHGIGFLAVFASGVAMRRIEHSVSGATAPGDVIGAIQVGDEPAAATDPEKAPAYMAEVVLSFNQQLEHIVEFVMVLLLGIMLSGSGISTEGIVVAAVLIFLIRPASAMISLIGARATRMQRRLMAWFGIRGIGSLYYLMFALQYSWQADLVPRFVSLVLTVLAISILVHGISATPLMEQYYKHRDRRSEPP
jgi:NhaP-type Na+/H+ or K+/H+ antiporter